MKEGLLIIAIGIVVAMLIMILHELFKSVVYFIYVKKYESYIETKGLFRIWRYIDPIGVIFSFCGFGVFSKQYPYVIKSRKAAVTIGLTGYISMMIASIVGVIKCRGFGFKATDVLCNVGLYGISNQASHDGISSLHDVGFFEWSMQYFWSYILFFAVLMLIINFFPIVSFDITLILGVCARGAYYWVKKNDAFIKGTFLILSVFGVYINLARIVIAIMMI